ncbi:MAG TPA: hypothetical protein VLA61_25580 [Ideonella sp.]|uniref:hypothetical protein n=1 Tax=Ideonella sp. TaxID=1929293 RepID=UPI002BC86068|nr:hypothetical protein [Ideonella sp.]HSI51655.1 hypothetical protein [Ideonella sp.]
MLLSAMGGMAFWPWPFWCLGLPFMALTLIAHSAQPALRPWARRLAHAGAALCFLALVLKLGHQFATAWRAVPTWVLVVLLLAAPLRLRGDGAYVALPLMLACAAGLLGRSIAPWHLGGPLLSLVTALALAITSVDWLFWLACLPRIRREAERRQAEAAAAEPSAPDPAGPPAAFDLDAHLDSDHAQEGADKYSRE